MSAYRLTDQIMYVVMGTAGEYADAREWIVCAYLSEKDARYHAEQASARARELYAHEQHKSFSLWDALHTGRVSNDWDPDMQVSYTGTKYRYYFAGIAQITPPAVAAAARKQA